MISLFHFSDSALYISAYLCWIPLLGVELDYTLISTSLCLTDELGTLNRAEACSQSVCNR